MAGEVDKILEGPHDAPNNIRSVILGLLLLAQLMSLRATLGRDRYRIGEACQRIERRGKSFVWHNLC